MQTDTLIVGAGLSGLALAYALQRRGDECLLLEARDRVGGRILSVESAPLGLGAGRFDLGPSWVWPGQPRIAALLEQLEIDVFEQYSEGRLVYQDESGQVRRDYDFSTMAGSLRIEGGISSITERLFERLPEQTTLLQHAVTAITQAGKDFSLRVETPTDNKTVTAGRVVLSVPPRVIAETIEFSPALPDAVRASLGAIPTWMAGHAKLVAVYETPFWREMGLSGDGISRCGPLMEIHDASPPGAGAGALFGFVGLPPGSPSREPGSLKIEALEQLRQMFGADAAEPVDVMLKDWSKEAFTATGADRATTHHPRYGLPETLLPLAQKGLLFASTEMAPQFGGFIEGALEAAENVLGRL
jgi:monoamine oxidase